MNNPEVKVALESIKASRKEISRLNKEKAQSLKAVESIRLQILEDNGYKMKPSIKCAHYGCDYWKNSIQTKFFELRLNGDRISLDLIDRDSLKNAGFENLPWAITPVSLMRYAKRYIDNENPILSVTAQKIYDDAKTFKDLLY